MKASRDHAVSALPSPRERRGPNLAGTVRVVVLESCMASGRGSPQGPC